jgi:uncharacterized protein (TIGR02246 family)
MKIKPVVVLIVAVVLVLSIKASLPAQAAPGAAETSAEVGKIRALEVAMMTAAEEKGAEGYLSFYADDAVELPAGAPLLQGKENIRKTMDFLNDKNNRLTWTAMHVDVASSGDLAYSYGVYEFRSKGKDGKPTVENGKYTTVWKKQSDGRWKVVLDMGNASPKLEGSGLR